MSTVSALSLSGRFSTIFATPPLTVRSTDIRTPNGISSDHARKDLAFPAGGEGGVRNCAVDPDGIGVRNSRTEICQILGLSFSRISHLGRSIAHAQGPSCVADGASSGPTV